MCFVRFGSPTITDKGGLRAQTASIQKAIKWRRIKEYFRVESSKKKKNNRHNLGNVWNMIKDKKSVDKSLSDISNLHTNRH